MKDNDKYFELEPVLDYIGPKGKWLMFQNVCLFFFGLASGLAGVSYAFPGYAPKYRCLVPLCGESLNTTLSYHKIIDLHEKLPLCQRIIPTKSGIQNCDQYINELGVGLSFLCQICFDFIDGAILASSLSVNTSSTNPLQAVS